MRNETAEPLKKKWTIKCTSISVQMFILEELKAIYSLFIYLLGSEVRKHYGADNSRSF